jgi:hypothetical protein
MLPDDHVADGEDGTLLEPEHMKGEDCLDTFDAGAPAVVEARSAFPGSACGATRDMAGCYSGRQ